MKKGTKKIKKIGKKFVEQNEFGIKRTDNHLCLICKTYIFKKNWAKHVKKCQNILVSVGIPVKADPAFVYKATLKSVGRTYKSEGETLEEALRKIKISGGAKAVSVLLVERGNKKIDKILSGITTHYLFGQGSPTAREIHLKKVKMLFDL